MKYKKYRNQSYELILDILNVKTQPKYCIFSYVLTPPLVKACQTLSLLQRIPQNGK